MRIISTWARHNVWASRLLIIFFIYPLLNLTGWTLAVLLDESGLHLSPVLSYIFSFGLLALIFFYPSKKNRSHFKDSYQRRKMCDLLLACTSFGFILLTGQQMDSSLPQSGGKAYAAIVQPPTHPYAKSKKEKRTVVQLMKKLRANYRRSDNTGNGARIFVAVVVAALLIFLLAGLACSIACGGAEALAYLVFVLGLGLIIFGLVRIIHRILKGPLKKPVETKTS
jgi:hypothetical protein